MSVTTKNRFFSLSLFKKTAYLERERAKAIIPRWRRWSSNQTWSSLSSPFQLKKPQSLPSCKFSRLEIALLLNQIDYHQICIDDNKLDPELPDFTTICFLWFEPFFWIWSNSIEISKRNLVCLIGELRTGLQVERFTMEIFCLTRRGGGWSQMRSNQR